MACEVSVEGQRQQSHASGNHVDFLHLGGMLRRW